MNYRDWLSRNNIPFYPSDSDYTTNSPSYYENLARKTHLIKMLAKKIWEYEEKLDITLEEIETRLETYIAENDSLMAEWLTNLDERLEMYITENDSVMTERLNDWDERLKKFPENVELLLEEWLSDGTLDHIINDTIFNWKVDQTEFDEFVENTTSQLAQTVSYVNPKVFGVVGDGVTDDTQALQDVINYASANNLKIKFDSAMEILISKVGTVTYPVGGSHNTSSYSIVLPKNARIDFNGSTVTYRGSDYFSMFIDEGVFGEQVSYTENIELVNLKMVGVNTHPMLPNEYNPAINLCYTKNTIIKNVVGKGLYDAGIRFLSSDGLFMDEILIDDVRGNGVYLGIQVYPSGIVNDIRIKNATVGKVVVKNLREGQVGSSCNPFIGCMVNSTIESVRAINCEMGIKIHNDTDGLNIDNMFFDGGENTTINSGLKIQGVSNDRPVKNVNVGNVISRNCGGPGLYIQYSKDVNIGSYIGENNCIIDYTDVWIHYKNIVINSIIVKKPNNLAIQVRDGSEGVVLQSVIIQDTLYNAVIDFGRDTYINSLKVYTENDTVLVRPYINTNDTSTSLVNYMEIDGRAGIIELASEQNIITKYKKSAEPLVFVTTLSEGKRTEIFNDNIFIVNLSDKRVKPYVTISQLSGAPVAITDQTYVVGGYRLTHETAIGDERIKVEIHDVHTS